MEYASQHDLYKKLLPVFNVKKRLVIHSKYKYITNENIWLYLIETKWKKSYNLTISEIVNDIITIDLEEINKSIKNISKRDYQIF